MIEIHAVTITHDLAGFMGKIRRLGTLGYAKLGIHFVWLPNPGQTALKTPLNVFYWLFQNTREYRVVS